MHRLIQFLAGPRRGAKLAALATPSHVRLAALSVLAALAPALLSGRAHGATSFVPSYAAPPAPMMQVGKRAKAKAAAVAAAAKKKAAAVAAAAKKKAEDAKAIAAAKLKELQQKAQDAADVAAGAKLAIEVHKIDSKSAADVSFSSYGAWPLFPGKGLQLKDCVRKELEARVEEIRDLIPDDLLDKLYARALKAKTIYKGKYKRLTQLKRDQRQTIKFYLLGMYGAGNPERREVPNKDHFLGILETIIESAVEGRAVACLRQFRDDLEEEHCFAIGVSKGGSGSGKKEYSSKARLVVMAGEVFEKMPWIGGMDEWDAVKEVKKYIKQAKKHCYTSKSKSTGSFDVVERSISFGLLTGAYDDQASNEIGVELTFSAPAGPSGVELSVGVEFSFGLPESLDELCDETLPDGLPLTGITISLGVSDLFGDPSPVELNISLTKTTSFEGKLSKLMDIIERVPRQPNW